MSIFPANRVPDILKRMDLNSSQAEAMKTCFGILAIMSRQEANKILIAKDGMEIILNAMNLHVERTDVQESGCDLLWSLAFNSSVVKDVIAKYGGAVVLVRALKRHSRSPDFLKSACGALSNMCQSKLNQEGVSSQGGLQPLVGSIHVHQTSPKLLPFIFDAIASIIVNNEENARSVSSLGLVPVVIASLSRHKSSPEVVKSGCHTLAILSDVKGQASKIAFAGGVPIILSLLDLHPLYADLHRVAAVVLLRMLQESAHVGREITNNEGIRILLISLEKGGAQQDTVAAVTHILYTVTNPSSSIPAAIEPQLWLQKSAVEEETQLVQKRMTVGRLSDPINSHSGTQATALGGIVNILGQYSSRRDVVRAACRLVTNLSNFLNVVTALDKLNILDKLLECASIHRDTKDVVESATNFLKNVHRRTVPVLLGNNAASVHGLLHIMRNKSHDEDTTIACLDTISKLIDNSNKASIETRREYDDSRLVDGNLFEYHVLSVNIGMLNNFIEADKDILESAPPSSSLVNASGKGRLLATTALTNTTNGVLASSTTSGTLSSKINWSKNSFKIINGIVSIIDSVHHSQRVAPDTMLHKDTVLTLNALMRVLKPFGQKNSDLTKRVEKLILSLEYPYKPIVTNSPITGFMNANKKMLSLKPPIPFNAATNSEETSFLFNGSQPLRNSEGGRGITSSSIVDNCISEDHINHVNNNSSPLILNRTSVVLVDNSDIESNSPKNWIDATTAKSNDSVINTLLHNNIIVDENREVQGNIVSTTTSNSPKKLLPQHPLKFSEKGNPIKAAKLLDTWPNYLERLSASTNAGAAANRSFLNPSGENVPTRMHLCYESTSAAGLGLLSRVPTPVPYLVPVSGLGDLFEHSLTFDSEFESGNLLRVVQKGESNYDLFLRSDLHTPGHTQWFYFAVANTHSEQLVKLADKRVSVPSVRVRFNIVNFTKPDSLFNLGMRPVVYSVQDAASKGIGWVRAGSDISYYSNNFMRNNSAGEGVACYYTLSFTVEFHNPKDTVLIAYSYPYTLTDYKNQINFILEKPHSSDVIRQFKLCQTLSGADCDLLVITNFLDKEKERIGPINMQSVEFSTRDDGGGTFGRKRKDKTSVALKPALFISCRVHPGETPASWMMKGMLEFLTSDCSQAMLLRQAFVIFIVPMLNPDGVLYGNNRCCLAGVDLNRQWKLPLKGMHPTVYHLKNFMTAQKKIRDINMYIDLHGHSRKYNVFMYGVDDKKKPKPQVRAFPKFFSMHNIGKKYVCFADCSFTAKKGRESTARVVVSKELNIPCSFTLEATFCGSNYGPLKHCHMNTGHMQEVGTSLCDAILNFSISEGQVKDTLLLVPANLKAVAMVEKAIEAEGLLQEQDLAQESYHEFVISEGAGMGVIENKSNQINNHSKERTTITHHTTSETKSTLFKQNAQQSLDKNHPITPLMGQTDNTAITAAGTSSNELHHHHQSGSEDEVSDEGSDSESISATNCDYLLQTSHNTKSRNNNKTNSYDSTSSQRGNNMTLIQQQQQGGSNLGGGSGNSRIYSQNSNITFDGIASTENMKYNQSSYTDSLEIINPQYYESSSSASAVAIELFRISSSNNNNNNAIANNSNTITKSMDSNYLVTNNNLLLHRENGSIHHNTFKHDNNNTVLVDKDDNIYDEDIEDSEENDDIENSSLIEGGDIDYNTAILSSSGTINLSVDGGVLFCKSKIKQRKKKNSGDSKLKTTLQSSSSKIKKTTSVKEGGCFDENLMKSKLGSTATSHDDLDLESAQHGVIHNSFKSTLMAHNNNNNNSNGVMISKSINGMSSSIIGSGATIVKAEFNKDDLYFHGSNITSSSSSKHVLSSSNEDDYRNKEDMTLVNNNITFSKAVATSYGLPRSKSNSLK